MNLSFLPNLLCLFRIALVYPIAVWIMQGRYAEVLFLFGIAAATDGLDGYLAKRFNWMSDLGKFLDPVADKLLMVTLFMCLSIAGHIPWWLTFSVLFRDLFIAYGAVVFRWMFGPLHGHPIVPSKFNTLFQILLCLAVIARLGFGFPPAWAVTLLGALVFVSTWVSGLGYILAYSRRAVAVTRQRELEAR
jgi:cardiolipin synthase